MVDRHIAMTKKHYPGAFVSPTTFGVVKIDFKQHRDSDSHNASSN